MSNSRRIVRKVDLPYERGFDAEFWPVVVAMSVLTAILTGAILALLSGIWMWASLMILPGLVGISLAALRLVNHRVVRRSLQFAIIISAALHLLLLVWSCFWMIFATYQQEEIAQVETAKTKPIRITFRNETPDWEQPEPEPEVTPDPAVKPVEKEQTEPPTEKTLTQVDSPTDSQNQTNNQRQSQQQPTVPKFGRALSKLSRQPTKAVPQTSEAAQASAAAARSNPQKSETQPSPTEISRSSPSPTKVAKTETRVNRTAQPTQNVRRNEKSAPSPSESRVAKSKSQPRNTKPVVETQPQNASETPAAPGASLSKVKADSSQPSAAATVNRRTTETQPEVARQLPKLTSQTKQPSKTSVRRTERTRPKPTPTVSRPTPQRQQNRTAQKPITSPPTPTEPTQRQTNLVQKTPTSRQVEIQKQISSNMPNRSDMRRSSNPSTNVAERKPLEQPPRRETSPTPSLPQLAKTDPRPRRTQMASPQVQSPQNIESPSMAKTNQTRGSSQMSPRPLALNKAETGTAGSGSSANLQRAEGPAVSPAKTASNSSRRSQTQSQPSPTQNLVAKQRSRINRSVTGAPVPQQVVKTDSQTGSVSGTPTPKPMTASASASIQSSSTNQNQAEMSADKGSASIDIGPRKIVADQSSTRTGGGGQPQISQQSITSVSRNSGAGPALQPLVASEDPANSVSAPLTQGSPPNQNRRSVPDAQSSISQRQSDGPISIGDPARSKVEIEPSPASISGSSQRTRSPQTRNSEPSIASPSSTEDDDRDRDNRLNRMIADLPSDNPTGSTGQNNSNDPSSTDSSNAVAADTNVRKQSSGTQLADRADTGSLVQANSENASKIANSSTGRRSRIGSQQKSEMLVGQSNIDRKQLSPQIGGNPGDSTERTSVPSTPGTGTGSLASTGKAADVSKSSSNGLSPADIKSATGNLKSAVASGLPATQSSRRNGDSPAIAESTALANRSTPRNDRRSPVVNSNPNEGRLEIPSSGSNPQSTSASGNDDIARAEKQSPPGIEFELDKVAGPGGLANAPDTRVGINSVRASRESNSIQPRALSRFRRAETAGAPKINPAIAIAKDAFRSRRKKRLSSQSPQTAKAIELGLAFLAKQQNEDGSWSLDKLDKNRDESKTQMISDTAATGLALLAFQGAGFNHREFYYSEKLNRAVSWLKENQSENGDLYVDGDERSNKSCQLYSHAIAALALCEAYGMTQDPELKQAAQKAIDFIQVSQDQRLGGWRYYSMPESMRRSDTSVSGWMVMALQSGRLAGLNVGDRTFQNIEKYLGFAKDSDQDHLFRYNPNANANNPKTRPGLRPTHSMTSVGLLMRMYLGWDRKDRRLIQGADHLLTRLPNDSTMELRDTYYWYYATQVLNHVGGERWATWKDKLEPLLIRSQVQDGKMVGSWDPYYPVPDRWGAHGGRVYVTAMNLLNLEVEYRKLPLYEDSGQ